MSAYGKRELFLILIFWGGSNEGLKTHLAHQDDDHAHVWAQADINKVLNKCWQNDLAKKKLVKNDAAFFFFHAVENQWELEWVHL